MGKVRRRLVFLDLAAEDDFKRATKNSHRDDEKNQKRSGFRKRFLVFE